MRARVLAIPVRLVLALVLAIAVVVAAQLPAEATTITVNTAADIAPSNTQQGLRYPNDGLCSLRAAITAAQNNSNAHDSNCATGVLDGLDVVQISPTLTGQTFTLSWRDAQNRVQAFDQISGPNNPLQIIAPTTNATQFVISGGGNVRPFAVGFITLPSAAGVLTIANLTIRDGNAIGGGNVWTIDGDGGAFYVADASTVTLDNVIVRNNTATAQSARGGAVYLNSSTLISNGGAFIQNSAIGSGAQTRGQGGAIFAVDDSQRVRIEGYAALYDGNTASFGGGAVAGNFTGAANTAVIQRSLLINNRAQFGGVLWANPQSAGSFVASIHD